MKKTHHLNLVLTGSDGVRVYTTEEEARRVMAEWAKWRDDTKGAPPKTANLLAPVLRGDEFAVSAAEVRCVFVGKCQDIDDQVNDLKKQLKPIADLMKKANKPPPLPGDEWREGYEGGDD